MVLIDGCKYYYKLDESSGNAIDEVGNQDGTVTGATQGTTGLINDCYTFAEEDNYVTITGATTGTAHTYSMWIKGTVKRVEGMYCIWSNGGSWTIFGIDEGSTGYLRYYDGSWKISSTDVMTGNWVHIVAITNGSGNLKMYVNDVKIFDAGVSNVAMSGTVEFGAQGQFAQFVGLIDELGIWDRAITEDEVGELYAGGSGLSYPFEVGTNMQINIADVWKDVDSIQINIADVWKDVAEIQQNIGDVWKTVY